MTNSHPLSADAKPFALIDADFADGTYKFALTWRLAMDWEADAGRSLYALFLEVVRTRVMRLADIREVIRIGLIGAGTEPTKALRMVRTYVEDRPASENIPLALLIFDAFFHGNEQDKDSIESTAVGD